MRRGESHAFWIGAFMTRPDLIFGGLAKLGGCGSNQECPVGGNVSNSEVG